MPQEVLFGCGWIEASVTISLLLRLAFFSRELMEGDTFSTRQRKQSYGWDEVKHFIPTFFILSLSYAGMSYSMLYQPAVYAGQPVPWFAMVAGSLSPLLFCLLYVAVGAVIIRRLYRPDS
jgi:hypothetical protein